jgi:hypothetical protein
MADAMLHFFYSNPILLFSFFSQKGQNPPKKEISNLNSIELVPNKGSEVLWRTGWGTNWELGEHDGNVVGMILVSLDDSRVYTVQGGVVPTAFISFMLFGVVCPSNLLKLG